MRTMNLRRTLAFLALATLTVAAGCEHADTDGESTGASAGITASGSRGPVFGSGGFGGFGGQAAENTSGFFGNAGASSSGSSQEGGDFFGSSGNYTDSDDSTDSDNQRPDTPPDTTVDVGFPDDVNVTEPDAVTDTGTTNGFEAVGFYALLSTTYQGLTVTTVVQEIGDGITIRAEGSLTIGVEGDYSYSLSFYTNGELSESEFSSGTWSVDGSQVALFDPETENEIVLNYDYSDGQLWTENVDSGVVTIWEQEF